MEGSTMVSGRTTSNMEKANSLGAMVVCTWAAMFKISERVKDFSHGKHPLYLSKIPSSSITYMILLFV